MLQELTTIESQNGNASPVLLGVAKWVRRFLCSPKPPQQVVGNRKIHGGGTVTQQQLAAGAQVAHTCPFMDEAVQQHAVWLDEHPHDGSDLNALASLLIAQIPTFLATPPSYAPAVANIPAKAPALHKSFINVFPRIPNAGGACPAIDQVRAALKAKFVRDGLMIGQFYHGCPQPGLYNKAWRPLQSAYPMLAVRYLVEDDLLFNASDPTVLREHKRYFP